MKLSERMAEWNRAVENADWLLDYSLDTADPQQLFDALQNIQTMKKHQCIPLLTPHAYRQLVRRAALFAKALTGDSGYARPEINRIVLESMLIGWLTSTASWRKYAKHCAEFHQNEDLYVIAQDQAVQAAQDAIYNDPELFGHFYNALKEANEAVARAPWRAKSGVALRMTRLLDKIEEGKKKLGWSPNI